jgi:AcrR family transcriptional regulator
MTRIVKEYAVRRNEILDAAQRLIYSKGYEQMITQDILDELQISRGALYHYFASKQAVLEALIERMHTETEQLLLPIVNNMEMPALEKLRRLFMTGGQWRTERKSLLLPLLRVWYSDENVLARQKMHAAQSKTASAMFESIIRQGIQEGVFNTPYPEQVARVLYSLGKAQDEAVAELFLSPGLEPEMLPQILATVAAYTDIIERILGAPKGSLLQVGPEMLKKWMPD